LQKRRIGNLQQPTNERSLPGESVQLVPSVHETVLRKVIGKRVVAGQLAQEVAHLRLVAADQFAEGCRVLRRDGPSNQESILAFQL
jgi:hypothetical protein